MTEKEIYKYSTLVNIFYKHLAYPLLMIFAIQLGFSVYYVNSDFGNLFSVGINLFLLIFLFLFYYKIFKNYPFVILFEEDKIRFSHFGYSRKIEEVKFSEIKKLEGGFLAGKPTKPIRIILENKVIFILPHLINLNKFISKFLVNINKEVYERIIEDMKNKGVEVIEKKKKRNKKG